MSVYRKVLEDNNYEVKVNDKGVWVVIVHNERESSDEECDDDEGKNVSSFHFLSAAQSNE